MATKGVANNKFSSIECFCIPSGLRIVLGSVAGQELPIYRLSNMIQIDAQEEPYAENCCLHINAVIHFSDISGGCLCVCFVTVKSPYS